MTFLQGAGLYNLTHIWLVALAGYIPLHLGKKKVQALLCRMLHIRMRYNKMLILEQYYITATGRNERSLCAILKPIRARRTTTNRGDFLI